MTNEFPSGRIGIVARSPALAREAVSQLASFELGASKVVCLGAEGGSRASCLELLKMFDRDWGTDAVLLLGEIDAHEVEACAEWIARHTDKPVMGFIAEDSAGARAQRELLRACGVRLSRDAGGIGELAASLVELPWLPFD
jgi:succinyl-CoA synthetase alpha subunit